MELPEIHFPVSQPLPSGCGNKDVRHHATPIVHFSVILTFDVISRPHRELHPHFWVKGDNPQCFITPSHQLLVSHSGLKHVGLANKLAFGLCPLPVSTSPRVATLHIPVVSWFTLDRQFTDTPRKASLSSRSVELTAYHPSRATSKVGTERMPGQY